MGSKIQVDHYSEIDTRKTRRSKSKIPPCIFQFTPPYGGRCRDRPAEGHHPVISIHAPRTGGDSKNSQKDQLFPQKLNSSYKHHLTFPLFNNNTAFTLVKHHKNPVRDHGDILCTWPSHLKHQDIFRGIGRFRAKVLNFILIAAAQVVKPQAVLLRVHDLA